MSRSEQVRRHAFIWEDSGGALVVANEDFDALWAELEQAEREINSLKVALDATVNRAEQAELERDEQHKMRGILADQSDALEARLARVPALVEALECIRDKTYGATAHRGIAREALAVWEQK